MLASAWTVVLNLHDGYRIEDAADVDDKSHVSVNADATQGSAVLKLGLYQQCAY